MVILSRFLDESPTGSGIRYPSKIRKLHFFLLLYVGRLLRSSRKLFHSVFFLFALAFINSCIVYAWEPNRIVNLNHGLEAESYIVGKNQAAASWEVAVDHTQ